MTIENPYTVETTVINSYPIMPFRESDQSGAFWLLSPGQATKVQMIVNPDYQLKVEAVHGLGFFLRLPFLSPGKLEIRLASPSLQTENPIVTYGLNDIVCFVASRQSTGDFAIDGRDSLPFQPEFEKQIPADRDHLQISNLGNQQINLGSFWQAHYTLKTQFLSSIGQSYPQLQPAIEQLSQ